MTDDVKVLKMGLLTVSEMPAQYRPGYIYRRCEHLPLLVVWCNVSLAPRRELQYHQYFMSTISDYHTEDLCREMYRPDTLFILKKILKVRVAK